MDVRERFARTICVAAGLDPDRKGNTEHWRWQEFLDEADAIIDELKHDTAFRAELVAMLSEQP